MPSMKDVVNLHFSFLGKFSVQTRLGVLTGMGLLITWHNTLIVVSSISKASLWFGR